MEPILSRIQRTIGVRAIDFDNVGFFYPARPVLIAESYGSIGEALCFNPSILIRIWIPLGDPKNRLNSAAALRVIGDPKFNYALAGQRTIGICGLSFEGHVKQVAIFHPSVHNVDLWIAGLGGRH